jgi:NAD(P)-dependent dehydrogenase (short-subunit alcohol dehydrogenase family)
MDLTWSSSLAIVVKTYGRLDYAFNNAGIGEIVTPFIDQTSEKSCGLSLALSSSSSSCAYIVVVGTMANTNVDAIAPVTDANNVLSLYEYINRSPTKEEALYLADIYK